MSQIREILRLRWSEKRTLRETGRALGVSASTVHSEEKRVMQAGLDWGTASQLSELELSACLDTISPQASEKKSRAMPDPKWIHEELKKRGVTLSLLHVEYLASHPEGYRYTAFRSLYREWTHRLSATMRQPHVAGEKAFVDYSGVKAHYIARATGELIAVEIFVMVLGASNLTYVEATPTQRIDDFVGSNIRGFEYFGGVPRQVVPDNLRSAVTRVSRYEPTINRTYSEFGTYYGTSVVPARPYKPRDKAKVEVAVQIAQRWILGVLRNEQHFSLESLNVRIRELVDDLNLRGMKNYEGLSRRELFERIEKDALQPLPAERFEVGLWRVARVSPDYHVSVEKGLYSVPYIYVGKEVEVRLLPRTLEVFFQGARVASHARTTKQTRVRTDTLHMPEAHRQHFHAEESLHLWSSTVGPETEKYIARTFDAQCIRERAWRSCKGIQRLETKFGKERLEASCRLANKHTATGYGTIERILKSNLDTKAEQEAPAAMPIHHENVRGAEHFTTLH